MTIWRSLLLIYSRIDVCVGKSPGAAGHYVHEMPACEIDVAIESFRCFPGLVRDLTNGGAGIEYEILRCGRTLSTLSPLGEDTWWPSPTDTEIELGDQSVRTRYDSVFVFWPQRNQQDGKFIKTGGWGLGMGASPWSCGATYATVTNIEAEAWQIPRVGEVWLHEWLHGVCAHFADRGHTMPDGDADGADRHGYVRSPETGWTDYYGDLMSGKVPVNGRLAGIPLSAWNEPLDRLTNRTH